MILSRTRSCLDQCDRSGTNFITIVGKQNKATSVPIDSSFFRPHWKLRQYDGAKVENMVKEEWSQKAFRDEPSSFFLACGVSFLSMPCSPLQTCPLW